MPYNRNHGEVFKMPGKFAQILKSIRHTEPQNISPVRHEPQKQDSDFITEFTTKVNPDIRLQNLDRALLERETYEKAARIFGFNLHTIDISPKDGTLPFFIIPRLKYIEDIGEQTRVIEEEKQIRREKMAREILGIIDFSGMIDAQVMVKIRQEIYKMVDPVTKKRYYSNLIEKREVTPHTLNQLVDKCSGQGINLQIGIIRETQKFLDNLNGETYVKVRRSKNENEIEGRLEDDWRVDMEKSNKLKDKTKVVVYKEVYKIAEENGERIKKRYTMEKTISAVDLAINEMLARQQKLTW